MVYEIVEMTCDPARREEYVEVIQRAMRAWSPSGYHGGKVYACIEDPARVIVLLEWDSVEAHKRHYGDPARDQFLAALAPYPTVPNVVRHYTGQELPAPGE
jgi:quinol monooxygenase YgiN